MVLKYVISPSSNPNNFIAKVWEAESDGPGGEVYTSAAIPAPHTLPYTLTITGLDRVTHILRLYDAVTDELLHEYTAEPKIDLVTVFDPIRFKIGDGGPNTPIAGSNSYQNDLLIGLEENEYTIFRNGYGELFPGIHYEIDSEAGSWWLLQTDDVFNGDPGEEIVIKRQPQTLTTAVNDSVVGKLFGGFVDISASRDYLASDLRKMLRFSGTCTYTFPVGGTIPIGYHFVFTHFGTSNGVGTIQFLNASLKWGSITKTSFDINRYCTAAFSFDGTNWNVEYITPSAEAAGGVQPLQILGCGNYSLGDVVSSGNAKYIVTHNLAISGDYNVFLSIKTKVGSEANWGKNNTTTGTWWHSTTDKPNKFEFSLESFTGDIQSIDVSWLIIKL